MPSSWVPEIEVNRFICSISLYPAQSLFNFLAWLPNAPASSYPDSLTWPPSQLQSPGLAWRIIPGPALTFLHSSLHPGSCGLRDVCLQKSLPGTKTKMPDGVWAYYGLASLAFNSSSELEVGRVQGLLAEYKQRNMPSSTRVLAEHALWLPTLIKEDFVMFL